MVIDVFYFSEGDISKIESKDIPNADILLGGSPCQSFSIAGYRKGFNDERGNLFFEYLRILIDKKPKAFKYTLLTKPVQSNIL